MADTYVPPTAREELAARIATLNRQANEADGEAARSKNYMLNYEKTAADCRSLAAEYAAILGTAA